MLKQTSLIALSLLLSALLLAPACDSGKGPADNFDRQALLTNFADNLIKPAYAGLKARLETLNTAVADFNAAPSVSALQTLRAAWLAAYTSWQSANAYNFGPAGESGLRKSLIEEMGTFPANTTTIESKIAAGQWDLTDFNRDARGFLAAEYLIFGNNQSDDAVVAAFAGSDGRRSYLAALAGNLRDRTDTVLAEWNGSYRDAFVQNDGTDAGSSTSALYNEFVRSFESLKNFKLGLPLGKRPGQTQPEPQLVEARYSNTSIAMLKAHFSNLEAIWYGRSATGQDGSGFREYLESVEGGNDLIASTETQLAAVKAALSAVSDTPSLSEQIAGDKTRVETLYTELQKLTRFFKSDLSSLLGIAITFSSGDGD